VLQFFNVTQKKQKKSRRWSYHLFAALENHHHPYFQFTNRFLGLVTLIAVLAVVLETVDFFTPYQFWIDIVEWTAVLIFTLEYIVRFLETKPRRKYIFSFFGIIDLLAIVPTYLGLGNFTFLKAARSVRTIRLLRIARLSKLARFKDQNKGKFAVLGINFEIYLLALFMLITILGGFFYLFESYREEAENIPLGMLWVIKIIIGGLPTPQPETFGGIVTLIITRFSAVMIFGFMIGLFGTLM
jgi:voltage-gated potassium channel